MISKVQSSVIIGANSQKFIKNEKEAIKMENKIASKSTDGIGNDKLSEIKNQIDNGNYKIDLQKTSFKMAQNLLNL